MEPARQRLHPEAIATIRLAIAEAQGNEVFLVGRPGGGFQVERVDRTQVRDIMTPTVFSVTLTTPAAKVVQEMLALKVHRLFVVDANQTLVGVVSTLDVLRSLAH